MKTRYTFMQHTEVFLCYKKMKFLTSTHDLCFGYFPFKTGTILSRTLTCFPDAKIDGSVIILVSFILFMCAFFTTMWNLYAIYATYLFNAEKKYASF